MTAEQEAQLAKLARPAGKPSAAELLKDAALRLLDENARFRAAVLEGKAYADRGEFIEEEDMDARFEEIVRCWMISIRWTPPAAADLQSISDYLRKQHPQDRQPTLRKLYQKTGRGGMRPYIGRPGRIEGTRELLFGPLPYIAVYRVRGNSTEIWRVFHTSQYRP